MLSKQSKMILVAIALHIIATASQVTAQNGVIQIETSIVSLNLVFTDRQGRRFDLLTKEDVEVNEDCGQQEITNITERPVRLVLFFNVNLSKQSVIRIAKAKTIALLGSA